MNTAKYLGIRDMKGKWVAKREEKKSDKLFANKNLLDMFFRLFRNVQNLVQTYRVEVVHT